MSPSDSISTRQDTEEEDVLLLPTPKRELPEAVDVEDDSDDDLPISAFAKHTQVCGNAPMPWLVEEGSLQVPRVCLMLTTWIALGDADEEGQHHWSSGKLSSGRHPVMR